MKKEKRNSLLEVEFKDQQRKNGSKEIETEIGHYEAWKFLYFKILEYIHHLKVTTCKLKGIFGIV